MNEKENNLEIIELPFNCKSKEDVFLFRSNDGFELHFTKDIFSKKIQSSIHSNLTKYLEVEIIDGEFKIINEFDEIHKFKTPADFYLPDKIKSKIFYEDLHKKLIDPNLGNFEEYSNQLSTFLETNLFPDFNLPKITISPHYEGYNPNSEGRNTGISINSTHVRITDEIPNNPDENLIKNLIDLKGFEEFNKIIANLKTIIDEIKIFRFKDLQNIINKNEFFNEKPYVYKPFIGVLCYLYTNGPWRGYWIKFGYDPKLEIKNYKYQIIENRNPKYRISIYENPDILKEVEKSPDWYLLKEFDIKNGFISEALINFIEYKIFSKNPITLIEEESDFDTFD